MIYLEDQSCILSEDNFRGYDFHNSANNIDNTFTSALPNLKYIISPLDDANSFSNNQPHFIIYKRKNRGRQINNSNNLKRKTHTSNFIDIMNLMIFPFNEYFLKYYFLINKK